MTFKVFQSLWGMESLPYGDDPEWSLREKLDRIAETGFDGVEIAWSPVFPIGREALDIVPEYELEWSLVCFPTSVDHFKEVAELFADSDARFVNVQGNVRPYTFREAIPLILGWLDVAEDAGLTVYFETHRDRLTTDLRYTLKLIDAIPAMDLVADLSHFVVGEEFSWPIGEGDEAMIQRILARSRGFHGRIASREQVQIPIGFPQHRQWLDLFLRWWEDGFRLWHDAADPDDELIFVTELGPPWYAITGADGRELSDRWEEALILKDHVREIWARVDGVGPDSEGGLGR
jgi:hypothetical protein